MFKKNTNMNSYPLFIARFMLTAQFIFFVCFFFNCYFSAMKFIKRIEK